MRSSLERNRIDMQRIIRFLLFFFMALVFSLALPWVGLLLDRRFALIWRLPFWIEPVSVGMLLIGVVISLWYSLRMTYYRTDEQQNDVMSAVSPEKSIPLRRSLNPLMLSGWLCGAALAFLLRSISLFGIVGILVIVSSLFIRSMKNLTQEPRYFVHLIRFVKRTPRWVLLIAIAITTAAAVPAVTVDPPEHPLGFEPGILVQVRCKPGTSTLWQSDFDQHIRPAIGEVIARGNGFTSFQFIQSTLPAQSFDFALLYTGKTFADLDNPKAPPHYAVLFRREGSIRALNVLKEMVSYEEQVTVTLVHVGKSR